MNNNSLDRSALRLSATLLLFGQILYVLVTLLHTGGEANNHPVIFAAYAGSGIWTAVHVAQFACMATMLAGLLGLFSALDVQPATARLVSRLGAASTTVTLALYGVVLAVDGVALKQAVNAWANGPEAEKAARFASAETCDGSSGERGATRTSRSDSRSCWRPPSSEGRCFPDRSPT